MDALVVSGRHFDRQRQGRPDLDNAWRVRQLMVTEAQ
jgi:hypothetical protein